MATLLIHITTFNYSSARMRRYYTFRIQINKQTIHSLVPRPSLLALNVACNEREEGLVHDVTHVMQRIEAR